jgi:hypothetical protein
MTKIEGTGHVKKAIGRFKIYLTHINAADTLPDKCIVAISNSHEIKKAGHICPA